MPAGVSGPLLSKDYLRLAVVRGEVPRLDAAAANSFARIRNGVAAMLGPATHPWQVLATAVRPLTCWLGWPELPVPQSDDQRLYAWLTAAGADEIALVVVGTGQIAAMSRATLSRALAHGTRWAAITDGLVVRLIDALQPDSRSHLDFDLDTCASDGVSLSWLARLLAPAAFRPGADTGLIRHLEQSDAFGRQVCRLLRDGVGRALGAFTDAVGSAPGRRRDAGQCRDEALTAVYRVLFLLFAEARQLVPLWHPVYRRAYSLEALRGRIAQGRSPRGTWAALQAIARLAHAGAEAGDLRVTAFNGRLFAPARSPLLDHLALDDRRVAGAIEALCFTSIPRQPGRHRIAYGELGVEELGSVYESLLDRVPAAAIGARQPAATARKTTGTFYTPRSIADALVRQTLAPLVADCEPEAIFALRVLDPAMGSGAFLVAAGRYLLAAWEHAMVERGVVHQADLTAADRAAASRRIASQCLFGVDRNPMAVQLAQLSIWLATLCSDRPLSFLDHHLIAGNSLIGATPTEVTARFPGGRVRAPLPLDGLFDWSGSLVSVRQARRDLESIPDDDVSAVRSKELSLSALARDPGLARWKSACDLWCVASLPGAPARTLYGAMLDRCLERRKTTTTAGVVTALDGVIQRARAIGCFHWPLEFPEVFLDADGRPRADGGFDAVIGNPPWEMLRSDRGRQAAAHGEGEALVRFARRSGVYACQGQGHANQFQLFVERALHLARPAGRIGLVVPAGMLNDEGSEALRRVLIRAHRLEAVTVFDNRARLFPIHRSFRFATLSIVRGQRTSTFRWRSGVADPARALDAPALPLTPGLLERLSGPGLAMPDLRSPDDLRLVEELSSRHPPLAAGWQAAFSRELNATDDRDCMAGDGELPVIEGKHLSPFRVAVQAAQGRARLEAVLHRLGGRAAIMRPRLAYRDVASPTNRTTLIAAILPPRVVSVHTVFCLRTPLPLPQQRVLCALLNSYVANYLVRRWVTTHVSTRIVSRLPVPAVAGDTPLFGVLARAAATLAHGHNARASLEAQVAAAEAYGLMPRDLAHVLDTFPLIPREERTAILESFVSAAPTRSRR
jgi:hypothetical protein